MLKWVLLISVGIAVVWYAVMWLTVKFLEVNTL